MKKLIMSVVAIATLSTSGFANYGNNDSKDATCKMFTKENIINKVIMNNNLKLFHALLKEDKSDLERRQGTAAVRGTVKGIANAMKELEGDLSVDFLKNIGVGTNTKLTWENLVQNFYLLNLTLYMKNEPTELLTFLNGIFIEENVEEKMLKTYSDKFNSLLFMHKTKKLDFSSFIEFTKYNNKKFNELFKYVALKDFNSAIQLIKTENAKSGTQKIIDSIVEACENPEVKDLKSLITFESSN